MMPDLTLWQVLDGGSDIAVIAIMIALWKIDRRLIYIETLLEQLERRVAASEIVLHHNEFAAKP